MAMDSGHTPLVLLAPAYKRWGTARSVKNPCRSIIVHSRCDDVVPFEDSIELCLNSPGLSILPAGLDHRLSDSQARRALANALCLVLGDVRNGRADTGEAVRPDEGGGVYGVARKEIGKLKACFPGPLVPSGLFDTPCRLVFQKENSAFPVCRRGAEKSAGLGLRKNRRRGQLLHGEAETETHNVVPATRFVLVTIRRAKVLGKIGKGTATYHTFCTLFGSLWINYVFLWIISEPVLTPLPNIAVHVVKPPGVCWETAYRRGF